MSEIGSQKSNIRTAIFRHLICDLRHLISINPERFQLAVQRRAFHSDEFGGA
jgi:hypothetical protein